MRKFDKQSPFFTEDSTQATRVWC